MPSLNTPIPSKLMTKEDAMYLSVGVVLAIMLVMLSPVTWVVWWLLADLGEQASGSYPTMHRVIPGEQHRRAA
jgi:4-hydroxybenzoate polyprenyltransferase